MEENKYIIGSFWTSKQRQGNSIHEVSYRACFKPELPHYFIERFSEPGQIVYDPFGGRGTTAVEASLMHRPFIINDLNPLTEILTRPRINPPTLEEISKRLSEIDVTDTSVLLNQEIDLSMFYNQKTLQEILNLRRYLKERKESGTEDQIDKWIRMVATNRLTGHSKGFFSVYTLPPNQAVTPEKQIRINEKYHNNLSVYKNVKDLIYQKSKSLLKDFDYSKIYPEGVYLEEQADHTPAIKSASVKLIVTSPPFLDVVNYAEDNWLRFWFNHIDKDAFKNTASAFQSLQKWKDYMVLVFREFDRILLPEGYVAFEVGEIRKGQIKLDEVIIEVAEQTGFEIENVYVNQQTFTKTSNIWGIKNNTGGTNTNRIVLMKKKGQKKQKSLKEPTKQQETQTALVQSVMDAVEMGTVKDISYQTVVEMLSGYKVLPFDKNKKDCRRILETLVSAGKYTIGYINRFEGAFKAGTRINEIGNAIEPIMIEGIRQFSENAKADRAKTQDGQKKNSGYPDIEASIDDIPFYVECKTYHEANAASSLRSFYLQPCARNKFKVAKDAYHMLIAINMEQTQKGYQACSFKIIALDQISLNMKPEFNTNNKRLYAKERILWDDAEQK